MTINNQLLPNSTTINNQQSSVTTIIHHHHTIIATLQQRRLNNQHKLKFHQKSSLNKNQALIAKAQYRKFWKTHKSSRFPPNPQSPIFKSTNNEQIPQVFDDKMNLLVDFATLDEKVTKKAQYSHQNHPSLPKSSGDEN